MSDNCKLLAACIDNLDEGLIVINREGKIKSYNQLATLIFGLDPRIGSGHEGGYIENGDIVIIADNCVGSDDGDLYPEDFKQIGLYSSDVKRGQGIVIIGRKGDESELVTFKTLEGIERNISIERRINGIYLSAGIDLGERKLAIKVGSEDYNYFYHIAAGHMVILNGETLKVKFYQAQGYTTRREDIKTLLYGGRFSKKGPGAKMPEVLNKYIYDLHEKSPIIDKLINAAKGNKNNDIKNIETSMNGIPVRCSVKAILDNRRTLGAALQVEDISELKSVIKQRDEALASAEFLVQQLKESGASKTAFMNVIGESEKIKKTIERAINASDSDSNIILLGESGTGKNLFAEAIHRASPRKNEPFVYINCASIPDNLLESELFGYEKGAFTGALSTGKVGKFEKANKGTVFLDEIGDLSLLLQAKLLDFLQTKKFTKIGGLEQKRVDVRIITATNSNLKEMVKNKTFREDLYYRINVISINIPPLRERKEDVKPLAEYLIPKICNRIKKRNKYLADEAIDYLERCCWKGNVRELENVLETAINIAKTEVITIEDLIKEHPNDSNTKHYNNLYSINNLGRGSFKEMMKSAEKEIIIETLKYTKGSRKEAMTLLKMGKSNFYLKLKEYEIDK